MYLCGYNEGIRETVTRESLGGRAMEVDESIDEQDTSRGWERDIISMSARLLTMLRSSSPTD